MPYAPPHPRPALWLLDTCFTARNMPLRTAKESSRYALFLRLVTCFAIAGLFQSNISANTVSSAQRSTCTGFSIR